MPPVNRNQCFKLLKNFYYIQIKNRTGLLSNSHRDCLAAACSHTPRQREIASEEIKEGRWVFGQFGLPLNSLLVFAVIRKFSIRS